MVIVVSGIPVEYKQQENDVSSQTDSNNFEEIYLEERMKESNKGKAPPEFMSTHPSSENRIENFKKWIPEVREKYSPYQHNYFFMKN